MNAVAQQGREYRSGRSGDVADMPGRHRRAVSTSDSRDYFAAIPGGMSTLMSLFLAAFCIQQAEAYAAVVRGWCGTPAASIEMCMSCWMFLPVLGIPAALCHWSRGAPIAGSLARIGVLAAVGVWLVAKFYMGYVAQ